MSLRLVRRVAKYWNPLLVRAPGLEYDPPRSRNAVSHSYLHLRQMGVYWSVLHNMRVHSGTRRRAARAYKTKRSALLCLRLPRKWKPVWLNPPAHPLFRL